MYRKKLITAIAFSTTLFPSFAQNTPYSKPILDTSTFEKWSQVSGGAISNDGNYVLYSFSKFSPDKKIITVLQTPNGSWKKELEGLTEGCKFSADSKWVFYVQDGIIWKIHLGKKNRIKIGNAKSFQLIPTAKSEWLVYKCLNDRKRIAIHDIISGKQNLFDSIVDYTFSPNGKVVILQKIIDGKNTVQLKWIDLSKGLKVAIWSGVRPQQIIFDKSSSKAAFSVSENNQRKIFICQEKDLKVKVIIKDGDTCIKKGLFVGKLIRFSKDGNRIFFDLEKREYPTSNNCLGLVNIWRYNDKNLPPEQAYNLKENLTHHYLCVFNITNYQFYHLQEENEAIFNLPRSDNDNITLVLHGDVEPRGKESWGDPAVNTVLYLVDMHDGSRHELPWKVRDLTFNFDISPEGKFVIYHDLQRIQSQCYEVATGKLRIITKDIHTDLTIDDGYTNQPIWRKRRVGIAGWFPGDKALLIYDRHDIWQVDPLGIMPSKNITAGFGERHRIILQFATHKYPDNILNEDENVILAAFNEQTKASGYFKIKIGHSRDPILLKMDSTLLMTTFPNYSSLTGEIKKAANANAWLVMCQSASESPNYMYTENLRIFQKISNVNPEKHWNWLTSELHTWHTPEGNTLQGILYKPENFDSTKRYPIIFNYYRQSSNQLNKYYKPEITQHNINIPWFVSRGYLVFIPDIHYKIPDIKMSVVNCIVSAGKYLSKLPFVDSLRMGLQGHSFGGLETGYVVTNSNLFAAACSVAGSYDILSDEGSILPTGRIRQGHAEDGFAYKTMWEALDLYIYNSPLFEADKVNTPLLMVAGEKDDSKPYDQNIEFFLALRRLGKKVWMLSYPDEGHTISGRQSSYDYTVRLTQFFDYYLKGTLPPIWMTEDIHLAQKGVITGYSLDTTKIIY